jgi:hypothetical protein
MQGSTELVKSIRIVYSAYIIHSSHLSNYSSLNKRDIVLDIAENLTQIGHWSLATFSQEQKRIELYIKLTRKDLNALLTFPMSPEFDTNFKKFYRSYNKLENEYHTGITDHGKWAKVMITLGDTLSQTAKLV